MCNILQKEFVFIKPGDLRKKWRYTYECEKCNRKDIKQYKKGTWSCLCGYCGRGGLSTEEFIAQSMAVHGDTLLYHNTNYIGNKRKVTVSCKVHGDFITRPSDHLAGGGCPKCVKLIQSESFKLSIQDWKLRLNKYPKLSLKKYSDLGGESKITLTCQDHGDFETTFDAIGRLKFVCTECARFNHQAQSPRTKLIGSQATLYYAYLPEIDMYKLGVTVQELCKRLGTKCEIIQSWQFEYSQALALEHTLHRQLSSFRYAGTKKLLKIGGSTELYKIDVLPKIAELLRASLE